MTGRPSAIRIYDALCVLLLVTWAGWLGYQTVAFGPHSYLRKHDTAESNTAFYVGLPDSAERGLLGYWHPQAASGVDALANLKTEQPIVEGLFRYFPHWSNSGVLLILQSLLASIGLFVLLRVVWSVEPAAAMLGGAAFALYWGANGALAGFVTWHSLFLPGLPLWVLALRQAAGRRRLTAVLLAAAAGSTVALGSFALLSLLMLPVLVAAWWGMEGRITRRHLVVFAVFCGTYFVLEGPTIAAMALLAVDSHRMLWPDLQSGVADLEVYKAGYRETAILLLRQNATLLWAGVAGWVFGGFRRRALSVSLLVCGAILLEIYFYVQIRQVVRAVLPVIGSVQFDRFADFFPYFAAVSAALGLHQIGASVAAWAPGRRGFWVGRAITVLGVVAVASVLVSQSILMNKERESLRQHGWQYATFFEQPDLFALREATRQSAPFRVATFADRNSISMANGVAWGYGFESADAYVNLYPMEYHEFWGEVIAPTLARREDLRDYFYQWGNRIYLFSPYWPYATKDAFETTARTFSQVANLDLLSLANVRYLVSAEELSDPRLRRWVPDAATVAAAGSKSEMTPPAVTLRVYENTAWMPRAFVVSQLTVLPSLADVRATMSTVGVEDLRNTAYLDLSNASGLAMSSTGAAHATAASFDRYEADYVELTVQATSDALLVVTNSFSPHWTATVNGAAQRLRLVDATFQGVAVPAGTSRVVLRYTPPWTLGRLTLGSGVGLVILAGFLWLGRPAIARRTLLLGGGAGVVLVAGLVGVTLWRDDAEPAVPWFHADWTARQPIAVRGLKLTTPAVDVPVPIERGPDATAFWERVAADGRDIRFTDADGVLLPFELERFDAQTRQMTAWVRLPQIPARVDGIVLLYYGNPSASGVTRVHDVWDDQYLAVWHGEAHAEGGPTLADSTRYAHDGLAGPVAPAFVDGRIGGGLAFNGAGSSVLVPGAEPWSFGTQPWTIEFWIKPAEPNKRVFGLFERGAAEMFTLMVHPYNFLYFERRQDDRYGNGRFPSTALKLGEWTHVTIRREQGVISAALNGDFVPASEEPAGFADLPLPGPMRIGANSYGSFEGSLDEIRISLGARRPPEWLRASYYAQTGELLRFLPAEQRPTSSR